MGHAMIWTFAMVLGCTDDKADTAEMHVQCAGNSIYVEVCIECGDAGGCDEVGYECRAICDADEDCPDTHECTTSDEGMYCEERLACD